MADDEQKELTQRYKRFQRIKELKAADPAMTSARALEVIREEERAAEEKGRAARDEEKAAKEREKAARTGTTKDNKPTGKSFSWPSLGSSGNSTTHHESSGMGVYITLIILSVIVLLIKNYIAYDPLISLLISLVLGVFFFIAVHYTPEPGLKISLVLFAFALDFVISQGLLYFIPESEIKNILITIHVFIWVILAVALFIMGVFDRLSTGKHLGAVSWLLLTLVIGFVLFLVFPLFLQNPLAYQQQSHDQYFQIAQQETSKITASLAETKNVWSDFISCTFDQIAQPTIDRAACLEEKKITRYCRTQVQRDADVDKCIAEQQETKIAVVGISDATITQPTKAEFVVGDYFPRKTFYRQGEPLRYPIELKLENPRKLTPQVEVTCHFTRGDINIPGKVVGTDQGNYQILPREHSSHIIICEPDGALDGTYDIIYNATLRDLQAKSRLQRAFIGAKENAWKETWIPKIMDAHFPGSSYLSQAPEEFARINFAFGNPLENPIIESTENVVLSSTVENVGRGKIIAVKNYELQLPGFSVDDTRCLSGSLAVSTSPRSGDNIYLPSCFITALPPELQAPSEYVFKEFEATLSYDYEISTSVPIEVEAVTS
ncbi:DUF2304 domain-containing protein [Candidatus Woesearchaeota archaeon]|nr:DUF2304 domain-containing protein [Candidatus Woesearchaeota archaeon]